jgi:hypothetical protein
MEPLVLVSDSLPYVDYLMWPRQTTIPAEARNYRRFLMLSFLEGIVRIQHLHGALRRRTFWRIIYLSIDRGQGAFAIAP